VRREEIVVAFSAPGAGALGNIWRITAKKSDFYLDPLGEEEIFHLSVHGPNDSHPGGHRFHVKVDPKAVATVEARGDFIIHDIPCRGHAVDGQALAPGAFRVARIRWLWDLQRPRFREAAALPGPLPDISDHQSGRRLDRQLEPNEAADLDLVVSYNQPHWPHAEGSLRDNARLGPLRNDAGMWLTVTSYRRSQVRYPAPKGLILPLPRSDEQPNRIMSAAPSQDRSGNMYWFVEAITSRELIEASRPNGMARSP
jgi:hypothetical protein